MNLHIGFYLSALRRCLGQRAALRLSVTNLGSEYRLALIEAHLLAPLRSAFEGVACFFDDQRHSGRGYYQDICFHIHAITASGQSLELVDGGAVDWTKKLLSNAKERLVISGIGSERLCSVFGK